jgi:hypothetical protein
MSKSTLKILPALMVAIAAALVTQPVFGGAVHQLVFTETSSTSLAITYDGAPLTVGPGNSSDQWTFSFPSNIFISSFQTQWTEPDNSNLVNLLDLSMSVGGVVAPFVQSDLSLSTQLPTNADGVFVQIGTEVGGVPVFATFHDLGDTAAVPDTGTTFSLFGLSLMGLGFLRRRIPA